MRYQFFYWWVKIAIRLFFKNIHITGTQNIPKNSPVIFAINHQNSLLDALVIAVSVKEPVHFMTRADIFKKPKIANFLKSLNLIPIYRIRDGYSAIAQNEAVFTYCIELLSQNKHILIFPEGSHDYRRHLRPLKKGIARMAVEATLLNKKDTKIIPIGINYGSHRQSHSWLNVQIGMPISTETALGIGAFNEAKTVNHLIAALEPEMKKNMVHFDSLAYIHFENEILTLISNNVAIKAKNRFDFQQQIAQKLNQTNEEELLSSYSKIEEYQALYKKHHLNLKMVGKMDKSTSILLFLFELMILPFVYVSKLFFSPAWLGYRLLIKQFKDKQWEASIKVVSIMTLYPLWLGLVLFSSVLLFSECKYVGFVFLGMLFLGVIYKAFGLFASNVVFKIKKFLLRTNHKSDYKKLCLIEKSMVSQFYQKL